MKTETVIKDCMYFSTKFLSFSKIFNFANDQTINGAVHAICSGFGAYYYPKPYFLVPVTITTAYNLNIHNYIENKFLSCIYTDISSSFSYWYFLNGHAAALNIALISTKCLINDTNSTYSKAIDVIQNSLDIFYISRSIYNEATFLKIIKLIIEITEDTIAINSILPDIYNMIGESDSLSGKDDSEL